MQIILNWLGLSRDNPKEFEIIQPRIEYFGLIRNFPYESQYYSFVDIPLPDTLKGLVRVHKFINSDSLGTINQVVWIVSEIAHFV